jgi:hypothetical protein
MKRLWFACAVLVGVAAAAVWSGARIGGGKIFFPAETRNPVTHLRWNDDPAEFQFAFVSDRTGGHRAEIFSVAVEKLNLLQPAFVLSVGDLIEGGKKTPEKLAAEWKEFDGYVKKLTMPFFYVPGNHDVSAQEAAGVWQQKLGRRYYHFVYRNVLFLLLNADDPPGSVGVGKEQIAYAQKTLQENPDVRWTIVVVHRPLWNLKDSANNGWGEIEQALRGRSYTVFCGHVHRYEKFVRQGMNYYQLATTGGSSMVRGVEYGEFDHLVWITMKKDGPQLANILLDAVLPEDLHKIKTGEPGMAVKRLPTFPVQGRAFYEGTPMAGAVVTLTVPSAGKKGAKATGVVEADGSFKLTTYKAFDGAPAGEYEISLSWREDGKTGPSLLPAKYAAPATSGLRTTIQAGANDLLLELKK